MVIQYLHIIKDIIHVRPRRLLEHCDTLELDTSADNR